MANYTGNPIDPSEKDMRKIAAYLYKLNEQLSYMFGNLTPDDNYSPKAYEVYLSDGEKITEVSASLGEIKLQMVKKEKGCRPLICLKKRLKLWQKKLPWKVL